MALENQAVESSDRAGYRIPVQITENGHVDLARVRWWFSSSKVGVAVSLKSIRRGRDRHRLWLRPRAALRWTRRHLFRAASRRGRELWRPWAHRGPSGDDDEEAGPAPGAWTPGRWRWCSRTRFGRWLRIGGTLRFGTGRRSGGAIKPQGVAHAGRLAAPGRMPQAEVADLVEALGEKMLEIATQELVPGDPADPGPAVLPVAVLEADGFVIQADDAPVGEGDAEDVAS